jgi:two-component system chemotaxis response regulator CheB/chemosensory pili system protein ChpB (putative protein-glutamate methylesterase)
VPESNAIAVALLYQAGQLGSHLKNALGELGAAVVYEAPPASVDRDALENSGARVVIVNLDADSDNYIDALYDVLDAGDYEVVFNDAQVSSNLQGWDQARWVRHLGSKILRKPEIVEPPRPPGAQAVPTPVQKSASVVPIAEKPGPAPVVAPVAPPPVVEEVPASERPTVKMPLPPELLAEPAAKDPAPQEPEPVAGVDAAELAEFAKLLDTPAAAAVPEPAATTPAPIPDLGDFAAELDALFAAADTKPEAEPASAPKPPATDDFDIALPADFDLALDEAAPMPAAELDALDIPAAAVAPAPPQQSQTVDELHDEFPAIFDQLDVDASAVPEAKSAEFKPAERPAAEPEPALPMEWSLEGDDSKPVTGKASFGIETMSAEEFLAPQVDESAKPAATVPEPTFTLELMPMEEAVAPSQHNPDYFHEQRLDEARVPKPLKVGTGAGISRVVVLGASIGGPEAVRDFLGALPAGFPALFVLAQHMGEEFLELMSAQLRKSVALTVRNPSHGERAAHGEVLIVPTTHRLQVDAEGVVTLAHLPEKMPYSPSIDQVMRDAADAFGDKVLAIIFSGMAHDAIEGSKHLKSKGGHIWAQDPDTCVISSMVDGAREAGVVEFLGSPKQLADKLTAEYGKA